MRYFYKRIEETNVDQNVQHQGIKLINCIHNDLDYYDVYLLYQPLPTFISARHT